VNGADEEVAADLERSADRAHARGGPAAAGALLAQAGQLTADACRRVDRFLSAAQANLQAGSYRTALDLLADVEVDELDPLQHARVELLRGHIAFASGDGNVAPAQLLRAAQELARVDLDMAREAYLNAWMAAVFAGGLAAEGTLPEVCRAVLQLPASTQPGKQERLLNALAMTITEGPSAAQSALRNVVDLFTQAELSSEETLRWGWFAHSAAMALWDQETWRSMLERQVEIIRAAGAYDMLPIALSTLSTVTAWCGDFAAAEALIAEGEQICDATGSPAATFAPVLLASLRGDVAAAVPLIDASTSPESSSRFGIFLTYTNWAAAVLHNGLGQHEQALAAAVRSFESAPFTFVAGWALPELAAARVGDRDLAAKALAQLEEAALPGGTEIAQGLVARSRALLREGREAERLYREAVDRLERTQLRPELGRAHLLFGEWLRREGREPDARVQLRAAHDQLTELGVHGFAERARRELLALGEEISRKEVSTVTALTTQESLIARLAGDGFSNSEIGAQLFLSARTVDWHLRKAFAKLGITSRGALPSALARLGRR
jgi:DNA-binding CsgD family transcriptional regulator/tetratricopeptide (TPR) repeat protein